jgi:hypothetical protein
MKEPRAWLLVRRDEPLVRIEARRLSADTGYSHAFDLVASVLGVRVEAFPASVGMRGLAT